MSEVMRFRAWDPRDVNQTIMAVSASDYDALAAQRNEGLAREEELRELLRTQTLRADAAVGDANDAERRLAEAEKLSAAEFEPDRKCVESDGCPTEGAVLKRFWRANQPDKGLCEFYEADGYPSLVIELVKHVDQLQAASRRNVKPWEDTMPPTLLPAHIERVAAANAAFLASAGCADGEKS